jgi:hypothetical protein
VSKFIKKATLEEAYYVASNLRKEDWRECVEGHGLQPTHALPLSLLGDSDSVSFIVPDGRTAGLAGVQSDGRIWMLTTPAIHDFPVTFAREAKRFIDSREEKILWNIVDKRNKVHLKLLKFLGFKFLREVIYGPNNLTFIEFCKCVHQ